ncbi:FimB/Mfa2 family fimbrial subunit [uncultured Bacteroides sp.]|uniref:FimB/Mfa2 family fimbrial subunit n=1 Tax=uncultured Bacteroides sp. TaxID=162156 RepID=UPI0025F09233|nr:FimB/Mfa2 family fimbrial subunit [uncultured Bacteroides sp.]
MQSRKRNIISQFVSVVLGAMLATVALSSCERIFEDLDPCPHGVSLRFVYDYNMEFANAFPKQVDCLTLYIYDDKDNYVDTKIVTGEELQDEDYRMTLDLEKGNYHFVAYGGLACDKSSFSLLQTPAADSKRTDLRTIMDADCLTVPERRNLHDMFWGQLTLATADLYSEGTVKMMKNTNSIRIVLQNVDGTSVKVDDFDFEIIDDNTLFNYDNDLLPNGDITYIPWAKGQAQTGVSIVGPDQVVPRPVEVAYAELSTSRLMTKNSPRLLVKRHEDAETVIDFPLNNYLLLMRSDRYSDMGDQEYLDRESRWTLYFFLQAGIWLQTRIVVNDWVVRINDIEM